MNFLVRLLAKDNNQRGDLFALLMRNLFLTLGYDLPEMNVHKAGREIDLQAKHRFEDRRAIAECKATEDPAGGNVLNKFVGVLDAEHDDSDSVTGYFISLSGFTGSALEQERQRKRTKVILLTGNDVVDQLIQGKVIISKDEALALALQCATELPNLRLDSYELVGHRHGWIWILRFRHDAGFAHCALIHSDGSILNAAAAKEVLTDDDTGLRKLSCLNPRHVSGVTDNVQTARLRNRYQEHLRSECGYISLDGLPADIDAGSRQIAIENLYIPLRLDVSIGAGKEFRVPIGKVLTQHTRLTILGPPGGGKSTLLKWLGISYAKTTSVQHGEHTLPNRDWLPLYIRCRELRGKARGTFAELLDGLAQTEAMRAEAIAFRAWIDRMLRLGRAMLLVDGLDEISDAGDRAAFVCTLRAALLAYPKVALVITSREAGFRHVASHLAPFCTLSRLSVLDTQDIRDLTVNWHKEVIGNTAKARNDGFKLADAILRNDRIQRLAGNPLLLTTLLLVKRWVGSLPTRRAALYGKAVEVLLMTWNTEAYTPISLDEALPQLCFVASAMMFDGLHKISKPALVSLVNDSRRELAAELAYVNESVDAFLQRIECRSSLLMMTGYEIENGQLAEFYEFRHLTFQEYLTAQALVEGWHRGRRPNDTFVSVLTPRLADEKWREVIPLAAVRSGKAADALIRELIFRLSQAAVSERESLQFALGNCLSDEVIALPETAHAAVALLIQIDQLCQLSFFPLLVRGRYGGMLREQARDRFVTVLADIEKNAELCTQIIWCKNVEIEEISEYLRTAKSFTDMLLKHDSFVRCEAALGFAHLLSRDVQRGLDELTEIIKPIEHELLSMLVSRSFHEKFSGARAIDALTKRELFDLDNDAFSPDKLFMLWSMSKVTSLRETALRRFLAHPVSCEPQTLGLQPEDVALHYEKIDSFGGEQEKLCVILASWYAGLIDTVKLRGFIEAIISRSNNDVMPRKLLSQLPK